MLCSYSSRIPEEYAFSKYFLQNFQNIFPEQKNSIPNHNLKEYQKVPNFFILFFDDAHFEKKKNSPPTPSSTKTISPSRMTTTTISRWLGLWADSESPNHFRLFQRGRGHFYAQCKKLVSCQGWCFYVDLSMFFIFCFLLSAPPLFCGFCVYCRSVRKQWCHPYVLHLLSCALCKQIKKKRKSTVVVIICFQE